MYKRQIHTPDSSRFWIAATYESRRAAGLEPENFDKEFVRLHYAARGYRGEGEPPPLPPDLAAQAAARYAAAYTMLTGYPFEPGETPAAARIARAVAQYTARNNLYADQRGSTRIERQDAR